MGYQQDADDSEPDEWNPAIFAFGTLSGHTALDDNEEESEE